MIALNKSVLKMLLYVDCGQGATIYSALVVPSFVLDVIPAYTSCGHVCIHVVTMCQGDGVCVCTWGMECVCMYMW